MADSRSTALVASLVGGYLLGRGGKGQAALGVAAYMAGKKLLESSQHGDQDGERESRSALGRLRKRASSDLFSAGVSALTSTVNRRLETVAESIENRSQELAAAVAPEAEDTSQPTQEQGGASPEAGQTEERGASGSNAESQGSEQASQDSSTEAMEDADESAPASAPATPRSPSPPNPPKAPGSRASGQRTQTSGRERRRSSAAAAPSRSRRSASER